MLMVMWDGMWWYASPLTELSVKAEYILRKLPSCVGREPDIELSLSSKYATSLVSAPSCVGTVPVKELCASVNRVTPEKKPTSVGIVPLRPCSLKSMTVARGEYPNLDDSCMTQ